MSLLEPGTQVARYTLLGKLDTGGMAELYLARQSGPSGFTKVLVLKLILPHLVENPKFVKMFHNEAKLAAVLNHPNIVQIYDFGVEEQLHYMAMEYIDGHNLSRIVNGLEQRNKRIPRTIALRIIAQVCEALDYAHSLLDSGGQPLNIIHRDVSLGNILLTYSGQVKLVDFGIAKAQSLDSFTEKGVLKGKFPYMAPELLRGELLDRRVDIYALGVTLYRLMLGRRPIDGENHAELIHKIINEPPPRPREVDHSLPEVLEEIILKSIHKDRQQRYQTARDLRSNLEQFLSEEAPVLPHHLAGFMEQLFPHGADETRLTYQSLAGASPTPSVVEARRRHGQGDALMDAPTVTGESSGPGAIRELNATISTLVDKAGNRPPQEDHPEQREGRAMNGSAAPALKSPTRVLPRDQARAPAAAGAGRVLLYLAVTLLTLGLGAILLFSRQPEIGAPGPDGPVAADDGQITAEGGPRGGDARGDGRGLDHPDTAPRITTAVRGSRRVDRGSRRVNRAAPPLPRQELQGRLSIGGLAPGVVFLNGEQAGSLPLKGRRLAPGKYMVRIQSAHHRYELLQELEVKAGRHHKVQMTPRRGTLRVLVRPWARVILDGKEIGNTPLPAITLFEGPHQVTLRNDSIGAVKTLTVRVSADQPKTVKVQLLP